MVWPDGTDPVPLALQSSWRKARFASSIAAAEASSAPAAARQAVRFSARSVTPTAWMAARIAATWTRTCP